jgi:hypothetical protein
MPRKVGDMYRIWLVPASLFLKFPDRNCPVRKHRPCDLLNRRGQVAVEFMLMFILVGTIFLYIFSFAISMSAAQIRSYAAYMVGRAAFSAASTNSVKGTNALATISQWNSSDGLGTTSLAASIIHCGNLQSSAGQSFRDIMQYSQSGLNYDVVSNAGVACSFELYHVLPPPPVSEQGENLKVAADAMLGSQISDDHCKCGMILQNTWKGCVGGDGTGASVTNAGLIDNGC